MLKDFFGGGQAKDIEPLRALVTDLETRQNALREQIDASAKLRSELAIKAAKGDMEARGRLDRTRAADDALWVDFDQVAAQLTAVRADLAAAEARRHDEARRIGRASLSRALTERLRVARELEQQLHAVAENVAKMQELAVEARGHYMAVAGEPVAPPDPLELDAVGQRLRDHCAGLGLGRFLGIAESSGGRPASLVDREGDAQRAYVLKPGAGVDKRAAE